MAIPYYCIRNEITKVISYTQQYYAVLLVFFARPMQRAAQLGAAFT